VGRLVYFETTRDAPAAIAREKQIKRYRRAKKIELITALNPAWDDLWPPSEVRMPGPGVVRGRALAGASGADPSLRSG
jgi:hypothetical protein